MIDENAFGLLLAHYDLESIEYSLGERAFLEYLNRFSERVAARLEQLALASRLRRVDLGHAIYLEFADGDQLSDPIAWARSMRTALVEADLPNVCVLTAGGRWVVLNDAEEADVGYEHDDAMANELQSSEDGSMTRESGAWRVSQDLNPENSNPQASPSPLFDERRFAASKPEYGPSEPLRKALAAEAFAQPATSGENDLSWGPGLYVEKDAIEQLGKTLKNAPTPLAALSAIFFRIGA